MADYPKETVREALEFRNEEERVAFEEIVARVEEDPPHGVGEITEDEKLEIFKFLKNQKFLNAYVEAKARRELYTNQCLVIAVTCARSYLLGIRNGRQHERQEILSTMEALGPEAEAVRKQIEHFLGESGGKPEDPES